jgi:hypothetical protein
MVKEAMPWLRFHPYAQWPSCCEMSP